MCLAEKRQKASAAVSTRLNEEERPVFASEDQILFAREIKSSGKTEGGCQAARALLALSQAFQGSSRDTARCALFQR